MKTYPRLLEATGITIEKIRKERKMTKTALADFSDLQDCYVRGIIKGKRNPTITAIYSICEALGLSPLEFFKRVTDELNGLNKPRKNLQYRQATVRKRPFMITVCCGKREKAPHVCSCRAFLRRNSCRAASLSQFLRGGAFGKKPLSRYLLRLRLVLRRAGGNGGLGDVVRMIADVLDDPENILSLIHI